MVAASHALDIEAAYTRYAPMVLRRCRALLRDENDAVDALHDVFVQVLRRRDVLDARAPSSLLYRIATNVCLNRIRSGERRPADPFGEKLALIADATSPGAVTARLRLERLFALEPDSTGTIAVMHLLEGHSLEDVAAAVGLSVSGVRFRLRRLRRLARSLEGVSP